jgi:hypothetical protein
MRANVIVSDAGRQAIFGSVQLEIELGLKRACARCFTVKCLRRAATRQRCCNPLGRFGSSPILIRVTGTGPPWKIYTPRGSKFVLFRTNFARRYFDLRSCWGRFTGRPSSLQCGFRASAVGAESCAMARC